MVCKNKLYFCFEILVPDLTHTNLFKVETWNLNLSWRTSNVLWLFYFTVQFPYSAFLVYKLSWFSSCYLNLVSYGGMFCISAKFAFCIFAPPYPGFFGGRPAAQPVLSAQNSATSDTIGVQERVEQKLKCEHFAKCFPIIRNFLQKLYDNIKKMFAEISQI